jgi:hypothetical protein
MKTIKKLLFTFLAVISVLAVDAKTIDVQFTGTGATIPCTGYYGRWNGCTYK